VRKTPPITDETALYQAGVRILARRAHSIHEMWQALGRKCPDEETVGNVIARLRAMNYLDDARYAKQFARVHAEMRKQGRFRIERELRQRGVADRHITAALDEIFRDNDEGAAVRQRLERKLRLQRGPLDQKKFASLYASLLRSGFSANVVHRELQGLRKRGYPLPETGEE
jgi:regulatory protein